MMYKKVIWGYKKTKHANDVLYLNKRDINHLERIYNKYNIKPESLNEVQIDYLADREPLIRFIIKELDILLKPKGRLIVNSTLSNVHANFIRSKSQIKYEVSVSTNGRYILYDQTLNKKKITLSYVKKTPTLKQKDSIDKWSFGIITNGAKNDQVRNLVESIIIQEIPDYEILICGPFENNENYPNIKVLDDVLIESETRGPITHKKNKIAREAQYENVFILHDRYLLPGDWFDKMKAYGNFFDLLTFPNIGPNGGRVIDWGQYNGKPSQLFTEYSYLLNYYKHSEHWYSQGGLILIKKSLFLSNLLDENLFWDELEDVQFSQIGNLKGWFFNIDVNNKIFTKSDRLSESQLKENSFFVRIIAKLKRLTRYFLVRSLNLYYHIKNIYE